jgi:pseudaminic acid synthase
MHIKIANKIVGDEYPVFIVAEISSNHGQDYKKAVVLIKKAKECGADAIKLQTSQPESLTLNVNNRYFKIRDKKSLWNGKTLYDLYKETYTPWEWQPKLKKIAEKLGLICFSTPFDKNAVDFLEKMDVPIYKVASFEITDFSLIEYIASKGKPILISTGIASLGDIKEVINICRKKNNEDIALLKCSSSYPTKFNEVNLKTICDLKKRFKKVIGLSDHTLSISVPVASVALGAKIIEKHIILNRKKYANFPDSAFSLEPDEFKTMVKCVRETEKALGEINYSLPKNIRKMREKFSRSLFVIRDIKKGDILNENNIKSIRPGYGIHPKYLKDIIGKKAITDIKKGTPLSWKLIK